MLVSLIITDLDENLYAHTPAYKFACALVAKKYSIDTVFFCVNTSAYFLAAATEESDRILTLWQELAQQHSFKLALVADTQLATIEDLEQVAFAAVIDAQCRSDKTITFNC
jgi:hypothetical protein